MPHRHATREIVDHGRLAGPRNPGNHGEITQPQEVVLLKAWESAVVRCGVGNLGDVEHPVNVADDPLRPIDGFHHTSGAPPLEDIVEILAPLGISHPFAPFAPQADRHIGTQGATGFISIGRQDDRLGIRDEVRYIGEEFIFGGRPKTDLDRRRASRNRHSSLKTALQSGPTVNLALCEDERIILQGFICKTVPVIHYLRTTFSLRKPLFPNYCSVFNTDHIIPGIIRYGDGVIAKLLRAAHSKFF